MLIQNFEIQIHFYSSSFYFLVFEGGGLYPK